MNLLDLPVDLLSIIFADLKKMHPHVVLIHKTIYNMEHDTIVEKTAYCFCAQDNTWPCYDKYKACQTDRGVAILNNHIDCIMANKHTRHEFSCKESETENSNIDCVVYACENHKNPKYISQPKFCNICK